MLYKVTIVLHDTKNNKNSPPAAPKISINSKDVYHDRIVQRGL